MLILIADDYPDVADMLASLLECCLPCSTVIARDGDAALRLALERRPDICILDIDVPGRTGIEVALSLRAAGPAHGPYPVACTGARLDPVRLSGAFDAFLRKPVPLNELLRLLQRFADPRP